MLAKPKSVHNIAAIEIADLKSAYEALLFRVVLDIDTPEVIVRNIGK